MSSTTNSDESTKLKQPTYGDDDNFVSFGSTENTSSDATVDDGKYFQSNRSDQDEFSPQDYSSPIKRNNNNRTWYPQEQQQQQHQQRFYQSNRNRRGFGYRNSPHQNQHQYRPQYQNHHHHQQQHNNSNENQFGETGESKVFDENAFFHQSMLEDPWAMFDIPNDGNDSIATTDEEMDSDVDQSNREEHEDEEKQEEKDEKTNENITDFNVEKNEGENDSD